MKIEYQDHFMFVTVTKIISGTSGKHAVNAHMIQHGNINDFTLKIILTDSRILPFLETKKPNDPCYQGTNTCPEWPFVNFETLHAQRC